MSSSALIIHYLSQYLLHKAYGALQKLRVNMKILRTNLQRVEL